MVAPRLHIDLNKIYHNANELITKLGKRGISITGVNKATLGSIEVANTLIQAGVIALGDSRVDNLKSMRLSKQNRLTKAIPMTLLRSPMLSEIQQVVMFADMSCNTEIEVIKSLSREAQNQNLIHQILLMVELGDLREGILADDLLQTVSEIVKLPNIMLKGIGTNLACRSGVSPSVSNMNQLSALACLVEKTFDLTLDIISGGNSANIQWALGEEQTDLGRVNNLRIGESILLGCETLQRQPIDELHTTSFSLVAEVIEAKLKPSLPTGEIAQTAFGDAATAIDRGIIKQAILAIGIQDVDPSGLMPPKGINILGASSDHLIVESIDEELMVGDEVSFQLNYSALLRAMTSPYVSKVYQPGQELPDINEI